MEKVEMEGPKGENPFVLQSRAHIVFMFALDIGFLYSSNESNAIARRELLDVRATRFLTDLLFDNVVNLSFAGLDKGQREKDEILDRAKKAADAGGKNIWSTSLLEQEAPFKFLVASNGESRTLALDGERDANFDCSTRRVRIFPRGVITLDQTWTLVNDPGELTVEQFIVACKKARAQALDDAWAQMRSMLHSLASEQEFAGMAVEWREADPTTETFIRQHLIKHSMVFLESIPGRPVTENVNFDNLSDHEKKPMVGILNLTEWFRIYSDDYVRNVFEHVVRNRQDEIYLTDNDCSVVALADYWSLGDPLLFYQVDLILATLFELSRLTHLRYLAYYLRSAPEALGALTLDSESGRMALSFVLDVERVVAGSSYDHPAEALIQHGFTRRFLNQIVIQRGTRSSLEELDAFVERVARALELRTGLDLSEMDVGISRRTWVVTVAAFLVAIIGVIVAIVIGIRDTSPSEVPPPESTTTTISRPTTTAPRP